MDPGPLGPSYNSMQQQAGLFPPFMAAPPPLVFPGQMSAMISQMGGAGAMMALGGGSFGGGMGGGFGGMGMPSFPQPFPTFAGSPPMMPGPGGMFMPMMPGAPASPYAGAAGAFAMPPIGMGGPQMPPGNMYQPGAMQPPPMYRGPMGAAFGGLLSPPAPPMMFESPFQAALQQQEAAMSRHTAFLTGAIGVGGRLGTDIGMAGLGGMLGRRALGGLGGVLGAGLGFMGAELGGIGAAGQGLATNWFGAPMAAQQAFGGGIEQMTRGFVSGGAFLHPGGAGFSRGASMQAARGITEMAGSQEFQRETFGRFNTQDVMRITQTAGQEGLMQGVSSPQQMVSRVREVARSVQAFMELANEPDVRRAIQVMGQMRAGGLNLPETMQAVQQGRAFARMAGTSFEGLMNTGGAMGASTFQSMGLTQGLGMRTGMANLGMAQMGVNAGIINPQLSNLVGGPQGLASMNTMFSGGFLQMPMMAPAMMNGIGGMNPAAMQAMMSGRLDPTQMAGMGANNLSAMAGRMGTGGLALGLAMQPLMQDTIGRIMQERSPFAARFAEDRMIQRMGGMMGMRGAEGFIGGAMAMGMDRSQAVARARELGSETFFANMQEQVQTRRRERRAERERREEADRPGMWEQFAPDWLRGATQGVGDWWRGVGETRTGRFAATTERGRQDFRTAVTGAGFTEYLRNIEQTARPIGPSPTDSSLNRFVMESRGARGMVADIGAMFAQDPAARREELRSLRDVGNLARQVTVGPSQDERRQEERVFGVGRAGSEARLRFARGVADLFGGAAQPDATGILANVGVRGMAAAGTNLLATPGNVAGGAAPQMYQLENLYVQARRGQAPEEQLRRTFQQSPALAMRLAGMDVQMLEGRAGRAGRAGVAGLAERMGGLEDTGFMTRAREREMEGYRGILGADAGARSNAGMREALRAGMNAVEDLGRSERDPARGREIRAAAHTMASLTSLVNDTNATGEQRSRAQSQLSRLQTELDVRFGRERAIDVQRTSIRLAGDPTFTSGAARQAARGMSQQMGSESGASMISRVAGSWMDVQRGHGAASLGQTAAAMGQANQGVIGQALRRAGITNEGEFTTTRFRDALSSISQEDIDRMAMSNQPIQRRQAEALRRIRQGDERGYEYFQAALATDARGQRAEQAVQEFRARREGRVIGHGGVAGWIRDQFEGRGLLEGEAAYTRRREQEARTRAMGTGAPEDVEAQRASEEIEGARVQARAAGLGPGDRLDTASQNLLEASRMLREAVQGNGIDNLINQPTS